MKSLTMTDRLAIAVSLLLIAGAAWIALKGPTTPIPVHFDLSGKADRFGSRYELAGVLAFLGVLNVIVAFLTGQQVKAATDPVRQKALRRGQMLSISIMAVVSVMICWASLGPQASEGVFSPTITSYFLSGISLLLGAVLGKVGPNAFIGVKTPWAYKSRLAWDKSNRLAGRLMFWIGVAGLIATPFGPQPVTSILIVVGILGAALWAVIESWRVWRTDPEAHSF